jgi:hypothetical protein
VGRVRTGLAAAQIAHVGTEIVRRHHLDVVASAQA